MKDENQSRCARCHFNGDCESAIIIEGRCTKFAEREDPFIAAWLDEMDYGQSKLGRELSC